MSVEIIQEKKKKKHTDAPDLESKEDDISEESEDQKGSGYVNFPILLSKIYTNNSSKELITSIEQLIKNLYKNKQITKQVYNNLIKAIT